VLVHSCTAYESFGRHVVVLLERSCSTCSVQSVIAQTSAYFYCDAPSDVLLLCCSAALLCHCRCTLVFVMKRLLSKGDTTTEARDIAMLIFAKVCTTPLDTSTHNNIHYTACMHTPHCLYKSAIGAAGCVTVQAARSSLPRCQHLHQTALPL
jgi:hypothetical protein